MTRSCTQLLGLQKNILGCENNIVGLYGDYDRETLTSHTVSLKFNQLFPGQNRLLQYKTALQSKRIIFGGGSVLHSATDINQKRHLMSLANPQKSLAVGVGIGPFNSTAAEVACSKFLNECGYVGVRDMDSYTIARSLSPEGNIHKTFDLAPLLLNANADEQASKNERSGIALTLCSVAVDAMGKVNIEKEEARVNQIVQLIHTLYAKTGEPITLIEFNGHSELGDWKINNNIIKKVDKSIPVTIKTYNPNPIAVMNDLSTYKSILSMRLHGSILGYLSNTPVLSINYHKKCNGWCEDINMPQEYQIDLFNLDIENIVKNIVNGISKGFKKPTLSIEHALQNSLSNWSI